MVKLFFNNGGKGCSLPCKVETWTFCDIRKSPLVERTSLVEDGYINSAALEIAADAIILAGCAIEDTKFLPVCNSVSKNDPKPCSLSENISSY